MIGCLLTGHGQFAPGLFDALEMIAGPQTYFEVVPFLEEDLGIFEGKIATALKNLLTKTDGVLILTDLLGGTPFKTTMFLSNANEKIEVLAGTNLPMLIEISHWRLQANDVQVMMKMAVSIGQETIVAGELHLKETETFSEEEGI